MAEEVQSSETTKRIGKPGSPILENIMAQLSDEGVGELKNWIMAGREGKEAVCTDQIYHRVRLDKNPNCVKAGNPYALYVESLRLAFCCGELKRVLAILDEVKEVSKLATLVFIVLNHCNDAQWTEEEKEFRKKVRRVREIEGMWQVIKFQINSLNPRRKDSYGRGQWYARWDAGCWESHDFVVEYKSQGMEPCPEIAQEFNGNRCTDCIVYRLSFEISKLA